MTGAIIAVELGLILLALCVLASDLGTIASYARELLGDRVEARARRHAAEGRPAGSSIAVDRSGQATGVAGEDKVGAPAPIPIHGPRRVDDPPEGDR